MLVLRRTSGQWVDVTHAESGHVLRIKVDSIRIEDGVGRCRLVFDDAPRHFEIHRPDAGSHPPGA